MGKRCAWGTCRNDSRFPHLQIKNKNGDPIKLFRFPAPNDGLLLVIVHGDSFVCKKDSYICRLHFVDENGPTPENPDPISAIASKEKVG
jgi:hypothetical protein